MEMAAIIAGVATVLVAFLPGISSQERAACLFIGASVAGYAVYVLNQRSGTFYFPAALFALPIAMIARACSAGWRDKRRTDPTLPQWLMAPKPGGPEDRPLGYPYQAEPLPQQWVAERTSGAVFQGHRRAADPRVRNEWRYWDGMGWTDYVANAGIQSVDPIGLY